MIRSSSCFSARAGLAALGLVGALVLAPAPAPGATPPDALPAGAADSALALFAGGGVFPREFQIAWLRLTPQQRPPGTKEESRQTFLASVVDRKLLAREVARRPFTPTPEQQREIDRARDRMIQNQLFARLTANLPEPTPEDLDIFDRRQRQLATARFITFADHDRARSWRQRLTTGTPMSAFETAVAREGAALAVVDTFRLLAAEQIPDTLARIIWALHPGQLSAVLTFGGEPMMLHLKSYQARPNRISGGDNLGLAAEYQRLESDRIREGLRQSLAAEVGRTFDEETMAFVLAAHLRIPPRNDVDSVTGVPVMRPNLPLPVFTAADTGKVIARTRDRRITLLEYVRFWTMVPSFTRPEIRERASLEAAVDRVVLDPEILKRGVREGLDRDPAVLHAVAEMREGKALDAFFAEEIEGKVKLDEKAIHAAWKKDPEHYNDRASMESRIIVVERRSLADSLRARLDQGASFDQLARDFSTDAESGPEGGKAGLVYRGSQKNAGLEDAMFATALGQVGGPEATPEGWVLWKIEKKEPEIRRAYEEARPMVERDWRISESERLLVARLAALREAAHVQMFPERVDAAIGDGGIWPE